MSEKVLLVANTAWYLYNFRLPLARHLRDLGFEVVFVSPRDAYFQRLEAENFRCIELALDRKSLNPFREALTMARLCRIYQTEAPAVCHHFTIKCVLYGTIAAKIAGVRSVVNAITGLGHAFLGQGRLYTLARPILRLVYRKILTARRVQVVFQNGDDFKEFQDRKMVVSHKSTIIRGSGVCLRRFAPRPGQLDGTPSPTVLFASRLIREKGILDYVEAARSLKLKGVLASFAIAGQLDPGNPSSISEQLLGEWREEGCIDYLGHIDHIEEILELATLVVLPSYREGTPRILLEAAAMGKPIIATDVPGCREIVISGVNGLLVPPRDPQALAQAIEQLLNDPEKMVRFGLKGRELAHEFEESQVISATLDVYNKARPTK